MKNLSLLIIVFSFFLISCVTTPDNQSSNMDGYKPQVNMFEEKDWISISEIELFQDDTSLYLYFSYTSDKSGKFTIFNPPSGYTFKKLGNLDIDHGTIIQSIEKDSLRGVEGITTLLFPGDFSNESDSTGFFIKNDEIRWNEIPIKPEVPTVNQAEIDANSQYQKHDNDIQDTLKDGSTPENAVSFAEYVFPDDFLINLSEYSKQQKTYKWKGRFFNVEFVVSDSLKNFQNFINNNDVAAVYDVNKMTEIIGEPLYYVYDDEISFDNENLPDSYVMVYAAMWTGDPVDSLSIEIKNNMPVFIETKYYGWFSVNGISGGQEFEDFKGKLDILDTISKDEAFSRIREQGTDAVDRYIVDYGMFATYKNMNDRYELTWEKDTATGIFIIHILLNNED